MATSTKSKQDSASNGRPSPVTKAGWGKLGIHRVTLPSSAVVRLRIPSLTDLLLIDGLPNDLNTLAQRWIVTEAMQGHPNAQPLFHEDPETGLPNFTKDDLEHLDELTVRLISIALVEPAMTYEELADPASGPPKQDLQMLQEIVTRRRVTDAKGVRLGVAEMTWFEPFRVEHECAEGCEACKRAFQRLSSVDLGDL